MINQQHKEYRFECPDSNSVIVFIHGILESPNQFKDFISNINNKLSVVNLLLPGHGGNGKQFASSGMKKWKGYVENIVTKLQQKYENIILVGHSMGALIAIEVARVLPKSVKALFLLAVPLCIKLKYAGIINSLKVVFDNVKKEDSMAIAAQNACSIEEYSLFLYLTWIPRYIELFREIYQARSSLQELDLPTVIFQSAKDEFVSIYSLKFFKRKDYIKIIILEQSGHFYYLPQERKYILKYFNKFIDQIIKFNNYQDK